MLNDAIITFDVPATLEELEPIEQNYQEFLKYSDSFMGWLLTLNKEEFNYVYKNINHDFQNDPKNGTSFLFAHLEAFKKGQHMMLVSELTENLRGKSVATHLIRMVREGLASYKMGITDKEWVFNVNEEGKEKLKEDLKL